MSSLAASRWRVAQLHNTSDHCCCRWGLRSDPGPAALASPHLAPPYLPSSAAEVRGVLSVFTLDECSLDAMWLWYSHARRRRASRSQQQLLLHWTHRMRKRGKGSTITSRLTHGAENRQELIGTPVASAGAEARTLADSSDKRICPLVLLTLLTQVSLGYLTSSPSFVGSNISKLV